MIYKKLIIIIPTFNAGNQIHNLISSLKNQCGIDSDSVYFIDSTSKDGTAEIVSNEDFYIEVTPSITFDHGTTRQLAIEKNPDSDFYIFLTQDTILAKETAIHDLLSAFSDPLIGCVYGRQLPNSTAKAFGKHARLFNYPETSYIRSQDDIKKLGIKTAFFSNSFAAYRATTMKEVGGFPSNVIFGEDSIVAAKMILKGWKVAYQASASVYHSHDYTILEEFRRYFDHGAMHSQEKELFSQFGKADGEGKRFVLSEWRFLLKENPLLLPESVIRNAAKLLGYKCGLHEAKLPKSIKKAFSMNKKYWDKMS